MFVDTSVFVAILSDEDDAVSLLSHIENAARPTTSALVMLETAMRLSTKLTVEPLEALAEIEALIREARIEVISIEAEHGRLAVAAFSSFGKDRGHPARLNLADCLSYACARAEGIPLLYKGNDFSRTDIA